MKTLEEYALVNSFYCASWQRLNRGYSALTEALTGMSLWRIRVFREVSPQEGNPSLFLSKYRHKAAVCSTGKEYDNQRCVWNAMLTTPQWGAADPETKVPSVENTELKRSPFNAWGRSVYSHTCYAYCQGFLPRLFLPFRSIHLHFFQNLPIFSCVGCG